MLWTIFGILQVLWLFENGEFVYFGWLHSHSSGARHRCRADWRDSRTQLDPLTGASI